MEIMSDLPVFYWRPGCGFCMALRWRLKAARIPVLEINIWRDAAAAARVRSIAGGNETVPTVVVGEDAFVNPSVDRVREAVRAWRPELLEQAADTGHRKALRRWWKRRVRR